MSRFEQDRDTRAAADLPTIKVSQNVECEKCGTLFDVTFDTGEYDMEMVTEIYPQPVICPNIACGDSWMQEYEGWQHHTDAG